jgi:hypothetical protein
MERINLLAAQLPPAHKHLAVIVDVIWGELIDKKDRRVPTISLVAVLQLKRKNGKHYTASKRIRLDTRGKKTLHEHLVALVGESTEIDFENVDVEAVVLNKCCIVDVVHGYEDGKTIAAFTTMQRDPQNTVSVPDGFVREKDRKTQLEKALLIDPNSEARTKTQADAVTA